MVGDVNSTMACSIVASKLWILEAGLLGYLDFINLEMNCKFVITDSGGLQEETTYLGKPCLTVRKNTERPVTEEIGTNEIVGTDRQKIISSARKILDNQWKKGQIPQYWDGRAAERIVSKLESIA